MMAIDPTAENKSLEFVAETTLPTDGGALIVRAYRDAQGNEPLAIFARAPVYGEPCCVRVHDACFTSEVLGSLKCDCASQLNFSLDFIREKGGVVIYLPQEGRGIGLANKILAYTLQEKGMDTVDANLALHFPADAREYTSAVEILQDLGVSRIHLLTNNPRKADKLKELGVEILSRVPVETGVNSHNIGYLETKRTRMGHTIGNFLLGSEKKSGG
jgi:3,4-dihydroxy 2-butanone 4-phosphate synthase / GTP cyclohydrolase II